MITVSFLGLGNRGNIYANEFSKNPDAKIVALCEKNPKILAYASKKYGVAKENCFENEVDFWAKGKLSDALCIATQDRDHYRHAINGLERGYHLMLEKPVSPTLSECYEIEALSKKLKLNVIVCHVLRYSQYYDTVKKVIDSGAIGEIRTITHTENIGYWHFSHSYVRGNWRREDETSPSILAKCCHDFDLIYYLTGSKCKSLYANATSGYFSAANAPKDSADRCLDCPRQKVCAFDCAKIYYQPTWKSFPMLRFKWQLLTGDPTPTKKMVIEKLKTDSPYGRCVYKCDNNVMETERIALLLENGVNATLTMNAFSKSCFRKIHISGTKGEIIGDDISFKFKLNIFGERTKKYRMVSIQNVFSHLGGDKNLVADFVDFLAKGEKSTRLTLISETLESHKNALNAEISRKENKTIIF